MVGHDGVNGGVAEVTGPDSAIAETRIEVNGVWMTRSEWKVYMHDCPHEHFEHPGVQLMDGTEMSICKRCLFIQPTPYAKIRESEEV